MGFFSVSFSRKAVRFASVVLLCSTPSGTQSPPPVFVAQSGAPFTSNLADWPFGRNERAYASVPAKNGGPAFLKRAVADGFPVPNAWRERVERVQGASLLRRLTMVNGLVNSIPYVPDSGAEWKHPRVFLKRGGDCDCSAVAKYVLLREMGVSADDIRVVGVMNRGKSRLHALTVVRSGAGRFQIFVLDNLSDAIRSAFYANEYTPLVSMSENGVWIHDERGVLVAPSFANPVIIEP